MSDVPAEFKFLSSHEWVLVDGDVATIGISDHAQELLGDLVYVELPEAGSHLSAGDSCAVVESVKAASDVYAPVSGEVLETNESLENSPELINEDAFGAGWLFRVRLEDPGELDNLLDADAYSQTLDDE